MVADGEGRWNESVFLVTIGAVLVALPENTLVIILMACGAALCAMVLHGERFRPVGLVAIFAGNGHVFSSQGEGRLTMVKIAGSYRLPAYRRVARRACGLIQRFLMRRLVT